MQPAPAAQFELSSAAVHKRAATPSLAPARAHLATASAYGIRLLHDFVPLDIRLDAPQTLGLEHDGFFTQFRFFGVTVHTVSAQHRTKCFSSFDTLCGGFVVKDPLAMI
jgi:hypothetical protein